MACAAIRATALVLALSAWGKRMRHIRRSGAPGADPLWQPAMALKEKLSFSLLLWRGSPRGTAGTGNLWDQCAKSAGSWCGMWQDQLRSCPARPGMPQPRASGCQASRDEPLPGSASWHRAALPLPLPSSGALWQLQAGNIWLCNGSVHYLAVAGSKTSPLAFTTLPQQRLTVQG